MGAKHELLENSGEVLVKCWSLLESVLNKRWRSPYLTGTGLPWLLLARGARFSCWRQSGSAIHVVNVLSSQAWKDTGLGNVLMWEVMQFQTLCRFPGLLQLGSPVILHVLHTTHMLRHAETCWDMLCRTCCAIDWPRLYPLAAASEALYNVWFGTDCQHVHEMKLPCHQG